MNIKKIALALFVVALLGGAVVWYRSANPASGGKTAPTASTTVEFVTSTITADGTVTAQNQAALHFQIAGKLIYLPFKEGDEVKTGQTVASLDSYTVQKQLQSALNNYRSVRDTFDQTKDNIQDNVQKAQMTNPYDLYSKAGMGGGDRENAINDAAKRILDQNQANLDNAVINVQIANNAFTLSTVASPLNGILLHEDVTVPGQNITPQTAFVVADPATAVFRANVPATNINYVKTGSGAQVILDGMKDKINGTVVSISPTKVTLPNGQSVYQVDIQSDRIVSQAKLDQGGTALIKTNAENVALVPAWTVLGGSQVWVEENGKPVLKTVKTGKTYGRNIEIIEGLTVQDKIIIDPRIIREAHQ